MSKRIAYLIIGNGIAGVTAAEVLRSKDTTGAITIVADDPFPVYYRPALKDYLSGRVVEEKLWARPGTFYQEQHVRFIPGRVTALHPAQHLVQLHNGQQIGYQKLLLASGARPRQLSCSGLDLAGVSTLRTVADYQQIVRRLEQTQRIVVCGSGTLALETAESLNHLGYQVTHLLRHRTLWSEVLDTTASDLVLQEERRAGIDVRIEEEIAQVVGNNGQVTGVLTTSGARIACEMVLIAIGIEPVVDFIRAGGIACGHGVQVNDAMRTSVPDIYAAGDLIEVTDDLTGRTRVLGQWYPAIQQARIAAHSMLNIHNAQSPGHAGTFYNATFLHGLDFVGLGFTAQLPPAHPYQELIADPQPRSYRKVLLHHGMPVGALLLGERKQALAFKRAIDHRVKLASVADRLFARDFDLDAWLDQQRVPQAVVNAEASVYTAEGHALLVPVPHPSVEVALAEVPLRPSDTIIIGRQPGSSLLIEHNSISRRHAEISCVDGHYRLRDMGSSNGTFVNNIGLVPQSIHSLQDGDLVRVGDVQLRFILGQTAVSSIPTGSTDRLSQSVAFATSVAPTGRLSTFMHDSVGSQQPIVVGMKHRVDVQALSQERLRFEIDMCIGCDRCMDACPVPMSSSVSIADLNHATLSDETSAHIAHFTHECIMCGSCVPVCPVDNHRDLLMLSLKQRLGVSWDTDVDLSRVMGMLPPGWTIPLLIGYLRRLPLFADQQRIPDNYLLHIFVASTLLTLMPGTLVIREGHYGRDLYLVLQGSLSLSATDSDGTTFPVAVLNAGEYTGEDGMLSGQPYNMTAQAQTAALVLQVPEQIMQRFMEIVPQVRDFFEQVNHAHSLKAILKRIALFQGVSEADIHALTKHAQVKQYDRSERLFAEDDTEGRPARETLHILLEGFVKVARHTGAGAGHHKSNERIIAYRQGGDYFAGGLDLLGDGRAVSVTSINRTRVAEVPRHALLSLLQRYPEVNQRFAMRLREYLESTVSAQTGAFELAALKQYAQTATMSDSSLKAGLHALISDGVVEGTEVLVIDLDKCIHCDECEEACARRHGHSRMNRKGIILGNISVASACRQCQDPVCMLCSRAGIARQPDGEVYITESCIGCGICAERCPYGAISIVNVQEEEDISRTSWERFSGLFTKGITKERGRKYLPMANGMSATTGGKHAVPGPLDVSRPPDAYEKLRKKLAIKCDLCAGYSDQACVQACPTGAAMRIQPTKFFGSTEEILQRQS